MVIMTEIQMDVSFVIPARNEAKSMAEAQVVLLDSSEEALDYAKTLCSEKCEFHCGSVLSIPFPCEVVHGRK